MEAANPQVALLNAAGNVHAEPEAASSYARSGLPQYARKDLLRSKVGESSEGLGVHPMARGRRAHSRVRR